MLCSEDTDLDDYALVHRLLAPKYEINNFDACGIVKINAYPRLCGHSGGH
jgi:hypothetical protein